MKAIDIGLIQARRTKLTTEIESHRVAITTLEAKLSELEIAERVFAELSLENDDVAPTDRASFEIAVNIEAVAIAEHSDEQRRIDPQTVRVTKLHRSGSKGKKPEGLPSIPDMILEAIRHAYSLGATGLDPAGLNSYVRGRYWPTVPGNIVGPTAWRMWKRGELMKDGPIYSLPTEPEQRNGEPKTAISSSAPPRILGTSDLLSSVSGVALTAANEQTQH
jgi:Fe-S-cluster formation regulator IscX/YfhJ